jgi:hypothetical protein
MITVSLQVCDIKILATFYKKKGKLVQFTLEKQNFPIFGLERKHNLSEKNIGHYLWAVRVPHIHGMYLELNSVHI